MRELATFSATLGLSPPWQVISVGFDEKPTRIDIGVEFDRGRALICPICGATGAGNVPRRQFIPSSSRRRISLPGASSAT